MPKLLPRNGSKPASRRPTAVDVAQAVAFVAVPGLALVLAGLLPGSLVLPVFAVIAASSGFGLAAWLWFASRGAATAIPRDWRHDVAAGLVLAGFAASMLADLPGAAQSLARIEAAQHARDLALR